MCAARAWSWRHGWLGERVAARCHARARRRPRRTAPSDMATVSPTVSRPPTPSRSPADAFPQSPRADLAPSADTHALGDRCPDADRHPVVTPTDLLRRVTLGGSLSSLPRDGKAISGAARLECLDATGTGLARLESRRCGSMTACPGARAGWRRGLGRSWAARVGDGGLARRRDSGGHPGHPRGGHAHAASDFRRKPNPDAAYAHPHSVP